MVTHFLGQYRLFPSVQCEQARHSGLSPVVRPLGHHLSAISGAHGAVGKRPSVGERHCAPPDVGNQHGDTVDAAHGTDGLAGAQTWKERWPAAHCFVDQKG